MKMFRDAPISDVGKKNQLGEDFLQKYPESRYRVEVYSWLVKGYLGAGKWTRWNRQETGNWRSSRMTPRRWPSWARLCHARLTPARRNR